MSEVAGLEGLVGLVRLLEQVGHEGLVGLLRIPRAAALGAEPVHHGDHVEQAGTGWVVRAVDDLEGHPLRVQRPDDLVAAAGQPHDVTVVGQQLLGRDHAVGDAGRGQVRQLRVAGVGDEHRTALQGLPRRPAEHSGRDAWRAGDDRDARSRHGRQGQYGDADGVGVGVWSGRGLVMLTAVPRQSGVTTTCWVAGSQVPKRGLTCTPSAVATFWR